MTRRLLILLLSFAPLLAVAEHATQPAVGVRETPASAPAFHDRGTADEAGLELPSRALDQATMEELQSLQPSTGGIASNLFNGEYVMKGGYPPSSSTCG
ncbi:MAG: hypothetical protein IPP94_18520 [Ignavibacteria bacterium]|nr:hypothetical protein [Ignavibacteria bacterium]